MWDKSKFEVTGSDGSVSEGNIVIDSGTTLTLLPWNIYNAIETVVAKVIKLERVLDPLCFKTAAGGKFEARTITFHFTGADVEPGTLNTFIRAADDVVCLSFKPSEHVSLFGNVAQMNFLVGYETQQKTISLMPTDCEILR